MKIFILFLLITLSASVHGQELIPGMEAPTVMIGEWIQNPDSIGTIKAYETRKPFVIDFFATWCHPCVMSIPHVNDLALKYKDRVNFIVLSEEKREVLRKFFNNRVSFFNIGKDLDGKTFFNYNIKGIPSSFLVNKDGFIAWMGNPGQLNEVIIDMLLKGEEISKINEVAGTLQWTNLDSLNRSVIETYHIRPLYSFEISEADSGDTYFRSEDSALRIKAPLKNVIFIILDLTSIARMEYRGNTDNPYIMVNYSSGGESVESIYQGVLMKLKKIYDFDVYIEEQSKEVLELRVLKKGMLWPEDKIVIPGSVKGYRVSPSLDLEADNYDISFIAKFLEQKLGIIVIDETGIKGTYDWRIPDLPYEELNQLLEKDFGLNLEKSLRPVEITVVEFKE